jgi:hypothetical protein
LRIRQLLAFKTMRRPMTRYSAGTSSMAQYWKGEDVAAANGRITKCIDHKKVI